MGTRQIGFYPLMLAIYTRITTHALTKDYSIFNKVVPIGTSMPYIHYGTPIGGRSFSFGACDIEAEDNVVIFNVLSDLNGDKEASQMMDNICQALTSSDLDMSGNSYTAIQLLLDFADIMIDDSEPANPVRHGVLRFRIQMA